MVSLRRIRIKLYFTLVLKTISINFKLSVTNVNNNKDIKQLNIIQ